MLVSQKGGQINHLWYSINIKYKQIAQIEKMT